MTNRKNIFQKIALLFHTVRYLKPVQIFYRLKYQLITPDDGSGRHELSIRKRRAGIDFLAKSNSFDIEAGFSFLNRTFRLSQASDWQQITDNKLWLYNLHYFDFLNSRDNKRWGQKHSEIIQDWIRGNAVLEGVGWEPYPVSLRIINWVKYFIRQDSGADNFHESLIRQVRFLFHRCEYHLLGNHLFANAKALIFAGLYFEGEEAHKWFEKGVAIVNKEIKEQVLTDGANFELSPMYHNIFLEDVLDIINLLQVYHQDVPVLYITQARKMLGWMSCMTHPDGLVSFFNDAAINIAPAAAEIRAYAGNLNIQQQDGIIRPLTHLKESGYIVLCHEDSYAILDVAAVGPDYLPGHAHADSLSFELSLYGKRLFVNSGTSVYGADDERVRQRGSAAHNTLVIDGEDSSEVWGGFRVARRARVRDIVIESIGDEKQISASHTGYTRLPGKPIHNRKWKFRHNDLVIEDQVFSNQHHEITIFYHIHPDWDVNIVGKQIEITFNHHKVVMNFPEKVDLSVEKSSYHPEFGLTIQNKKIILRWRGQCPVKFNTEITWS